MTWLLNPHRFGTLPSAFSDAFDVWWAKNLNGSGNVVNTGTNPNAATATLDPVNSPTHTPDGRLSRFSLNGTSQYLTAPDTALPGLLFTTVTVFSTATFDNRAVFAKSGDGTSGAADLRVAVAETLTWRVFGVDVAGPTVALDTRHVASVRRNGTGTDTLIRVDGSTVNAGTVHGSWNESQDWYVGARWTGSASLFLEGDFFLHAFWKRQLSAAELTEIESYFA